MSLKEIQHIFSVHILEAVSFLYGPLMATILVLHILPDTCTIQEIKFWRFLIPNLQTMDLHTSALYLQNQAEQHHCLCTNLKTVQQEVNQHYYLGTCFNNLGVIFVDFRRTFMMLYLQIVSASEDRSKKRYVCDL